MEAISFFQEKSKITERDDKHMHIESTLVFMSSSNRSIFVGFFSFLWQFLFHHPGICVDFGSSVHLQKSPWAHPSPSGTNPKPTDLRMTVALLWAFWASGLLQGWPILSHKGQCGSRGGMDDATVDGYGHQLRLRGSLSTIIYRVSKASQVVQDFCKSTELPNISCESCRICLCLILVADLNLNTATMSSVNQWVLLVGADHGIILKELIPKNMFIPNKTQHG